MLSSPRTRRRRSHRFRAARFSAHNLIAAAALGAGLALNPKAPQRPNARPTRGGHRGPVERRRPEVSLMAFAASVGLRALGGVSSPADGRPGRPRFGVAALAALLATCHSSRRTPSRASFIQLTTRKGSMTHSALGHHRLTGVFIHRQPSAATTSMPSLCSRASSSLRTGARRLCSSPLRPRSSSPCRGRPRP